MEGGLLLVYALLSVELVLLVISVVLLAYSRREHRGRTELVDVIYKATRELTRYEYFLSVVEALGAAKSSVSAVVTGRRPTTEMGSEALKRILEAMADASKRGVKMRYIIQQSPDRLWTGYEYRRAGAEVRVHPHVALNDLRYMVVDGSVSVLGLAGEKGRGGPTKMGFVVSSSTLSEILLDEFENMWREAVDLDSYAVSLLKGMGRRAREASAEQVASALGIPVQEAKRLLEALADKR